ncbi:glycosyl transferase, group 1 [Rubellimicrobium mesophilum DSM 19309]|uniref:Glycosyl transferase, group 1 n=1 Tax=Rubellimicrobium mesophilum DSM 19309 TaxID=442562 RepID=A0A017HMT3_9RHOB|nr:glycosyltransferase family 4 protein [Rubellimicrobium mesophilum]EYD75064.1 glycosyl transferase, group 1 [Rubellimicrobium mesophilum DSM 19309]
MTKRALTATITAQDGPALGGRDGAGRSDGGVAIWSADYSLRTGQAIVTRRVAEHVLPRLGRRREYVFGAGSGPRAIAGWLAASLRLWRDVLRGRVATLYLVCSRSNAGFVRDIPALLVARAGPRVIVHAHGSDIGDLLTGRPLSPLARLLYRRAALLVPSEHLRPELRDAGVRDLRVCENFHIARERGAQDQGGPLRLVWNSNLMASKGFFDTHAAVSELRAEGLDIEFHVLGRPVGDEELSEAEVRERVSRLVPDPGITVHGSVAPEVAAEIVARADAVALPSRYSSECQPLALIEAMCAGKAIVAGDTPALRATLAGYPADYVPLRSVASLADALRRLDREKRLGAGGFAERRRQAADQARLRFSADRFDREMEALLSPARREPVGLAPGRAC